MRCGRLKQTPGECVSSTTVVLRLSVLFFVFILLSYFVTDISLLTLPDDLFQQLGVGAPRINVPVQAPYSFNATIVDVTRGGWGSIDSKRLFQIGGV